MVSEADLRDLVRSCEPFPVICESCAPSVLASGLKLFRVEVMGRPGFVLAVRPNPDDVRRELDSA